MTDNMDKATVGVYDQHIADPMSGGSHRRLTDNEAVDILIRTATSVYSEPGIRWRNLQETKFNLEQQRSRAQGMAGRSFDGDRIMVHSDTSDNVIGIMAFENAVSAAETAYFCAMASFRYCLERAKEIGAFDSFQASVWKAYYEHGSDYMSMQQLADKFHVTKSRIQYLITSTRAKAAFCRAIDSVISDIDFSSDTDSDVCEVSDSNNDLLCNIRFDANDSETESSEYDELALPDFTKI